MYMRGPAQPANWASPEAWSRSGFWRKILEHPAYDSLLAATRRSTSCWQPKPLKVPCMLVHSLWDQEDIYGATAVYKAIEPKDTRNDKLFLVLGPWHHGQEIRDGSSLGAIRSSTATRHSIFARNPPPVPGPLPERRRRARRSCRVIAYETGTNRWRLAYLAIGCLRVQISQRRSISSPAEVRVSTAPGRTSRPSTSTSPIPPSPCHFARVRSSPSAMTAGPPGRNGSSMTSARPPAGRTCSPSLRRVEEPLKISGQPVANLVASTSGTDSDWVVKLIDVYPDEVAGQPGWAAIS